MSAHNTVRFIIYSLLIFAPLARASVRDWALCVIHIMTLLAFTVFLLDRAYRRDWNRIKTPLDMPLSVLFCLCILSTLFSVHPYAGIRALMLLLNYIVIFYLVIHTVRTRTRFRQIVYVISGTGIFLSVFGFMKQSGINPFPWWEYSDIGQNSVRLSATYGNPDHLAGYMEMVLPLISAFLLTGYFAGIKKLLFIYTAIFMFTALMLSLSRGGWIGFAAGMLFMLFCFFRLKKTGKKWFFLFMAGILTALIIFLASTPAVERFLTIPVQKEMTMEARLAAWRGVLDMIGDYPLLGSGPGTFADIFTQYQPPGLTAQFKNAHNDYLHFISETGILLIPLMVWIIFVFYKTGFEKAKSQSRLYRSISIGTMGGISAMLVHSIGDFNLHIPANALLFSVLAGLAVSPLPKHRSSAGK